MCWKTFWGQEAPYTQAVYSASHIAVIGHSGGTTGSPKSILLRDQAINGIAMEYTFNIPYKSGERFLCAVIPFVLYGLCINVHVPLILRREVILVPRVNNKTIADLLLKYRPNHISSVPSVWAAIVTSEKLKNEDFSYLVTDGSGGDGMTVELEEQINQFLSSHNSKARIQKG